MGHALNTIWCKYAAVAQCSLSEEKDLVCNNTDLNFKRLKKKKKKANKKLHILCGIIKSVDTAGIIGI